MTTGLQGTWRSGFSSGDGERSLSLKRLPCELLHSDWSIILSRNSMFGSRLSALKQQSLFKLLRRSHRLKHGDGVVCIINFHTAMDDNKIMQS